MKKYCLIAALGIVAAGCSRPAERQEITQVVENAPPVRMETGLSTPERLGISGSGASPHGAMPDGHPPVGGAAAATGDYHWDTPPGWEALPASSMRLASFQLDGNPDAEVSFTRLSGSGGGLTENVNRWRKQVGQPPLSEEEVAALPRRPLLGRDAALMTAEGTYSGMGNIPPKDGFKLVGLLLVEDSGSYFVKMTAPAEVADRELANFEAFCASIHPAGDGHSHDAPAPQQTAAVAPAPAPTPAPAPAVTEGKGGLDPLNLRWTAPAGWTRAADRAMRLVTYTSGAAECYVTLLSGTAGGSEANINRWQGQMGQPDLTPDQFASLRRLNIGGIESPYVEIRGTYTDMAGAVQSQSMMLGTVTPLPDQTLFVKMVGPEADVAPQVEHFIAFCESIH